MPHQTDVSGQIARWLFRLGIVWAIILIPVTVFLFLPSPVGGSFWLLGIYCLIGFAVWLGWRWRSRDSQPALRVAAVFWVFSAAFNSSFVIYFIAIGAHWTRVLLYDQTAYFAWWWIAASLASLVAFAFEFTLLKRETRPA